MVGRRTVSDLSRVQSGREDGIYPRGMLKGATMTAVRGQIKGGRGMPSVTKSVLQTGAFMCVLG